MKKIPLTRGQFAIVDDGDYDRLSRFRWQAHRNPSTGKFISERHCRCVKKADGKWKSISVSMQEEIMGRVDGMEIDHRNLDSLDNRRRNLRHCTRSENAYNRRKRRGCELPFKGVCVNNQGRFTARIIADGMRRSVGTFKTLIEAARAYNAAALAHYGAFARLNEIKEVA